MEYTCFPRQHPRPWRQPLLVLNLLLYIQLPPGCVLCPPAPKIAPADSAFPSSSHEWPCHRPGPLTQGPQWAWRADSQAGGPWGRCSQQVKAQNPPASGSAAFYEYQRSGGASVAEGGGGGRPPVLRAPLMWVGVVKTPSFRRQGRRCGEPPCPAIVMQVTLHTL